MEKTPKEYFVKVDVNDELPTSEERYHVIKKFGDDGFTLLDSSKFYKGDNKFSSSHVTHWLKPISSMPEQEWVSGEDMIEKIALYSLKVQKAYGDEHGSLEYQKEQVSKWMRDKLLNKSNQ